GAGVIVGRSSTVFPVASVQAQEEIPPELQPFFEVWHIASTYFIDQEKLDYTQMTYGAINGVLKVLGDEGHTRFLPPQQAEAQKESISGKFYGIGATVTVEEGYPAIIAPISDSPAERAGIQAGDLIVGVDGIDMFEKPLNEAIGLIKGDEGTEVVLTILRRKTGEELEIPIIRGEIKSPAASWIIIPETDIGLIYMSQFSANLENNLKQAIAELKEQGATRLIVDVRNNPGGLLDQAIDVTSNFLVEGNVLLEEDAQGNRKEYAVQPNGIAPDIPLIVLTNRGSASASEIFSGALQDHDRATVIGETTFGTGTVLQPFDLSDGSTLLLGISQWLSPKGRLIRKQGIEPDIIIELPPNGRILVPGAIRSMTPAEIAISRDSQLLRALEEYDARPEINMGSANQYWETLQLVR
ncbi:S41 family peptidase, partial [Anaerolineales bacterium HSG24]|nr:S41 family peptidase [Anaerolineales bacterium HSG24]